jgi:hypothetical protein
LGLFTFLEGNIDRGYKGSPTKKEHKDDNSLLSYPAKAMLKKEEARPERALSHPIGIGGVPAYQQALNRDGTGQAGRGTI